MKVFGLLFAPIRLFLFLIHVVDGLLITLTIFRFFNWHTRQNFIRIWSRILLILLGVRLKIDQPPVSKPMRGMLVSNHTSWIDIFVTNAVQPVRFIAKSEIKKWPVLGTLVSSVGTLYVERKNRHAISQTNQEITASAKNGDLVGLYPEGTTTDGTHILPFKSNLFQPAIDNEMHIYPLGVTYTQNGRYTPHAAYAGDTSLVSSLWQIASSGGITAHARFGTIIPAAQYNTRQDLAKATQDAIARLLGQHIIAEEVYAQIQTGV
ncbi:lysophospholipid acyltransferase family protein [Hydromonas duriensis]|uniref:Lyso-ornithine lipid acyltransferase n=1 Tax=Hydromonas duriensis TaxID=1527608 RepID=A0A4R6YAP6_9BURK|nr:lysophospholipid acyltransferase family protein [Hydromonas duriensis]TDR32561.1 lyso-ornithine lipid acyltransferase [Hydromonas duriensis]